LVITDLLLSTILTALDQYSCISK